MSFSTISPDEIRGREAVRGAVEEARKEQRRKRELLKGVVQEKMDKFLHGTDGIHHSGVQIKVEKRHMVSVVNQEKRIKTMRRIWSNGEGKNATLDPEAQEVIDHAEDKLTRDFSILEAASFRGPQVVEIADHREAEKKRGLGESLKGFFGRVKRDEVIEVEAEEL